MEFRHHFLLGFFENMHLLTLRPLSAVLPPNPPGVPPITPEGGAKAKLKSTVCHLHTKIFLPKTHSFLENENKITTFVK